MIPTSHHTNARRWSAAACQDDSFAARTGALVGIQLWNWVCAETGLDIGDFLKEEIKGPATFSCTSGAGCKFEEPAMNQLINDIFGDKYISLTCEGGECLHYSQVPGYVVRIRSSFFQLCFLNISVTDTTQTE